MIKQLPIRFILDLLLGFGADYVDTFKTFSLFFYVSIIKISFKSVLKRPPNMYILLFCTVVVWPHLVR
jgi:hypothetical protein